MGATTGDRVVTLPSIVGAIGGDAADHLVSRDLAGQIGQHRRIADVAPCDFHGPDLQGFFVYSDMDFAPDAPLRAAMLAGLPLPITLDLDPGAVDQKV